VNPPVANKFFITQNFSLRAMEIFLFEILKQLVQDIGVTNRFRFLKNSFVFGQEKFQQAFHFAFFQ